jgi:hypothetical protein
MEKPALTCARCGRTLGPAEPPAFATVVRDETRALCAKCTQSIEDVGTLTDLLNLEPADTHPAGCAPPAPATDATSHLSRD